MNGREMKRGKGDTWKVKDEWELEKGKVIEENGKREKERGKE